MSASNLEFDVCILGGGLAGGTLALQILKNRPSTKIAIIDKRSFPLVEGRGAVGESLVELASEYLGNHLGLQDHLKKEHLPKLGLRYFLESCKNDRIEERLEVGGNKFPPTPSYQIDRAKLENHLWSEIEKLGGTLVDQSSVKSTSRIQKDSSSENLHKIEWRENAESKSILSRWLIDATGRSCFLAKKKDLLTKTNHSGSAVWWRLKGDFKIDDWCSDPSWKAKNGEHNARWFSTNHLMGEGYWLWIIPLSSGLTSFGLVASPSIHPFSSINTFEKVLDWLSVHEPQLGELSARNIDQLQDFRVLKNYSYGVEKVFSPDRWALTGEASGFIDPFYSPSSDFIAISNSFISDLVLSDLRGEEIKRKALVFNEIYMSLFNATIDTYRNQYDLIGNPLVTPIKVYWDWTYYWSFLAKLFFSGDLCKMELYSQEVEVLSKLRELNLKNQKLFSCWNETQRPDAIPGFLDLADYKELFELNSSLSRISEARRGGATTSFSLKDCLKTLTALSNSIEKKFNQASTIENQASPLPPESEKGFDYFYRNLEKQLIFNNLEAAP